jgi:ABC-type cobalt transport system substrate-binding protein
MKVMLMLLLIMILMVMVMIYYYDGYYSDGAACYDVDGVCYDYVDGDGSGDNYDLIL